MATLITDPWLERRVQAEREATGADRYDEVWEGVYMMAPMPGDEHQDIVMGLAAILHEAIQRPGLGKVRPGINVSDRREGWKQDYRVPDVAVFLNSGTAENLGTHWVGGPDFAVEVISPLDRAREKIPFYEKVGVGELLIVDRDPWRLELYRLRDGRLEQIGRSELGSENLATAETVSLTFQLVAGDERPQIQVVATSTDRKWIV
jgi:Uma2 family endonuclease